jgi:hypothetical protein
VTVTNRALYYFAAQMRDGMFRERFAELGFDGNAGDIVSVITDETPAATPVTGRMLLVREDETEKCGWRMWWAQSAART